jgi:ATP-binding cassette subfamily F protein 3
VTIVRNITRSVQPGQRIGILGANGQGKSTLVKTLAGSIPALGGGVTEGKGLAIGYFAQQEMDVLTPESGPMEHMVRLAKKVSPNAREQELRNFLGQFRFTGDMVHQAVGSLSGGEKARLVLAMLVWQRPNLLLLDEPTNHLDLTTREALSMALNEFEGTVMLVSHDRALLREVCDEFWLVTRGGVEPFDGDLDDYQKWLLEQSREAARALTQAGKPSAAPSPVSAPASSKVNAKAASKAPRPGAGKLKAELEGVERKLAASIAWRDQLTEQMVEPGLDHTRLAELGEEFGQLDAEIGALETRWLELSEALQAVAS